jgi:hypothetical protein
MEQKILNAIYEMLSDDDLLALWKLINFNIKGFRQEGKRRPPRSLLISGFRSQKLPLILKYLDIYTTSDAMLEAYREMPVDVLIEQIESLKAEPVDVMFALLSSKDQTVKENGFKVWQHFEEDGKFAKIRKKYWAESDLNKTADDEPEQQTSQPDDQTAKSSAQQAQQEAQANKKIRKLTDQLQAVKNRMDKQQKEFDAQRKKWEQERSEMVHKVRQSGILEAEVTDLKQKLEAFTQENEELKYQLGMKNLEIEALKQQLSALQAAGSQMVSSSAGLEERTSLSPNRIPVALVCNPSWLQNLPSSLKYKVEPVEESQFDKAVQEGLLERVEEVWVLDFDVQLKYQRKIRQTVEGSRLKEIANVQQLKRLLANQ